MAVSALLLASCGALPNQDPPSYALVYGIARYSDYTTLNDLTYTDDDAVAIHEALVARGYEEVILRLDADATKEQLESDFADLAARVPQDATFVFYFAGHGYGDGMEFQYLGLPPEWYEYFEAMDGDEEPDLGSPFTEYLFLYNAMPISSDVESTIAHAVSDDELATLVASIPARTRVVVIDACHSGGFIGSTDGADTIPDHYIGDGAGVSLADALASISVFSGGGSAAGNDLSGNGSYVLAAAGEREFSWESGSRQHGIFTYFLLEALSAGDADSDGYITLGEVYEFTSAAIMSEWNEGKYITDPEYAEYSPTFLPRAGTGAVDPVLVRSP